jgi:hypothetical protein
MPTSPNRQIVLRSRPVGMPKPGDFELIESPVPAPKDGEVLCRTIYLSLDPYMRARISGARSYAQSVEPGQVIVGGTVGEVLSDHMARLGDFLKDCGGWVREGRLKHREDIVVGLEKAPEAFIGLLQGKNFGKLLVRAGEDPTR